MRVHLGGHLNFYDPERRSWVELHPSGSIALMDLVRQLGLPLGEIAIAAVNGEAVSLDEARAADGDRVEFFPPVGGGRY